MDFSKLISSLTDNLTRSISSPGKQIKREIQSKTNPHRLSKKLTDPITRDINNTLRGRKKPK